MISDVHGVLVALEAVLSDLARDLYDEIVCLGDVALRGPQPLECLERVRELGCPVVMGNTDEWLLDESPAWRKPDSDDPVMEIDLWCAERMSANDREFIRGFQPVIELPVGGGDSPCFFHGSPRDNTENILATTPEADLEEMIAGCQAAVLVGGHTHLQMLRRKYEKTIINVGSVGLPFLVDRVDAPSSGHSPVAPWAEYAMLDFRSGGFSVDFRRAPVDLRALEREALASGMPHAAWWLDQRDRRLAGGPEARSS